MDIVNQTLQLLELTNEADLVIKPGTHRAIQLTIRDFLNLIVRDGGSSFVTVIFKGHDMPIIRKLLANIFYSKPKLSNSSTWYSHILSINGFKKCPHCNEIKQLDNFANNKAMKYSGKESWCKVCMRTRSIYESNYLRKLKKEHQINNKQAYAEASARRRARKLKACPGWIDLVSIKEFYSKCPEGYHVDHWAPLQGLNVCGLHTIDNLQYLPASLNISKGTSFKDSDSYRKYGTGYLILTSL